MWWQQVRAALLSLPIHLALNPPPTAECVFGDGYSFYVLYIFQMVLPLVCVSFCVGTFYLAELALSRVDPARERRPLGKAAGGLVGWLEGLKIRWVAAGGLEQFAVRGVGRALLGGGVALQMRAPVCGGGRLATRRARPNH
jgi:hypothetical protein